MSREARMAAAAALAAKRRQEQRRRIMIIAPIVVVALAAAVFAVSRIGGGGGKAKVVAANSTTTNRPTTTAPAATGSAAGKACVAVADPLPKGAPPVPVKVGPPPTQLVISDIKAGSGAAVAPSDTITVNYIGVSCSTGKIFDSSYSRNAPATFALSGVIKGWQDGIPGMKVGGQRLLGIPPAEGYGSQSQALIAPDETLWFVIDLIDRKAA